MNQQELGARRVCYSCQARFYDLKKKPIVCPRCQATFDPLAPYRAKRISARSLPKEVAAASLLESLDDIGTGPDLVDGDDLLEDPNDLDAEDDVVGALDHHGEDA